MLAYTLGNFMRMLAMPKTVELWSPTSWPEKPIKIGAKVTTSTFCMSGDGLPLLRGEHRV